MAIALRESEQCVDFFQQTILRTVRQWQESEAINQIDVSVLDRNRLTILNIINRGLEYQPSWPELKELVIAFASYMERRGHWDIWRSVLNTSISVARALSDTDAEITLTALFARLSQRQGISKDVVLYYHKVIRLARVVDNKFELARACSNLGFYYVEAGHWWRSETLGYSALAIFEELGSMHGLAHTYNHLGMLYIRKEEWIAAEVNLTKACEIWKTIEDNHSLIHGYVNLGLLYNETDRSIEAVPSLTKAMALANTSGEQAETGHIFNNLGTAYVKLEEYDSARTNLEKAEQIFQLFTNPHGLAHVWHTLGVLAFELNQLDDGEAYVEKSFELHLQLQNWSEAAVVALALFDYLSKENKPIAPHRHYLDELEKHVIPRLNVQQQIEISKHLALFRSALD